jgi:hypothetical protein
LKNSLGHTLALKIFQPVLSNLVSNDPADLETLTPEMLLTPWANYTSFPPGLPEGATYHQKKWRLVQHLTDVFWTRWQKEYLQTLRKRSKWHIPQNNLVIEDVVLLMDKRLHRSDWPKAIVTSTEAGPDGFVRTVTVRTSNGSEYERDIRKLALLEAAGELCVTVTPERHLSNKDKGTPDLNCQDMQSMQDTQGMQGTQGTQGTQDELNTTKLRRSRRIQENQ